MESWATGTQQSVRRRATRLRRLAIVLVLLLAQVAHAQPAPQPRFAVFNMQMPPRIVELDQQRELSGVVRSRMFRVLGDRLIVISEPEVVEVLKQSGRTAAQCNGQCEIETARVVGADYVASGTVGPLGAKLNILMHVIRTSNGRIVAELDDTVDAPGQLHDKLANMSVLLAERLLVALGNGPTGPRVSGGAIEGGAGENVGPRISGRGVSPALARLIARARPDTAEILVTGDNFKHRTSGSVWDRADLRPGRYTVEASAGGYQTERTTVDLLVDDLKTVKLELRRLGSLEITGTPAGARVDIRGPAGMMASKGLPSVRVENAVPGSYAISVSKAGYETEEHLVTLDVGQNEHRKVALKPPGSLVVDGTPSGARVDISGPSGYRATEGLPCTVQGALRGQYTLRVSRDGYQTESRTVQVQSGEIAKTQIELRRIVVAPAVQPPAYRPPAPTPRPAPLVMPTSGECRERWDDWQSRRKILVLTDLIPVFRSLTVLFGVRAFDKGDRSHAGFYVTGLLLEASFYTGFVLAFRDGSTSTTLGWTLFSTGYLGLPVVDAIWTTSILSDIEDECGTKYGHGDEGEPLHLTASPRLRPMIAPLLGPSGERGLTFGISF